MIQDDWSIRQKFDGELLKDEEILWFGQPDPSVHLTKNDFFLIPFSLLWGGFAVFWEIGVISGWRKHIHDDGPVWLFPLFGVPFVLIGLYMIFGRFIYKAWRKRRTYYAVTNKRVIVLTETKGRNTEAVFVRNIPSLNKSRGFGGTGTIVFSNSNTQTAINANSGLGGAGEPAFYDIKEADEVYSLVSRLMNES